MTLDEDLLRRADVARTGATAHEIGRLRNGYCHYVTAARDAAEDGRPTETLERLAKVYADDLEHVIATGQRRR